jgi:hypothetical protein
MLRKVGINLMNIEQGTRNIEVGRIPKSSKFIIPCALFDIKKKLPQRAEAKNLNLQITELTMPGKSPGQLQHTDRLRSM